jgi:GTPase KRas protein
VFVDEEQTMLDVLDTAGQEEYRSLRDQYIRTCDAFLIVYSVIDRKTFETEIEEVISSIKRVKDVERINGVLFGNKCDLESNREVSADEGKKMASEVGLTFLEGSAKLYKNIDEAFFELVRIVRKERGWVPKKGKKAPKKTGDTSNKKKCTIL